MTLTDMIDKAALAYQDALILEYWDRKRGCPRQNPNGGDTLAQFIVNELADVFDPEGTAEKQVAEATRALNRAAEDIRDVVDALNEYPTSVGGENAPLGPLKSGTLAIPLGSVDWPLLEKQKLAILDLAETDNEDVSGIVNFLDSVQDKAAEVRGEEEVFGKSEE